MILGCYVANDLWLTCEAGPGTVNFQATKVLSN